MISPNYTLSALQWKYKYFSVQSLADYCGVTRQQIYNIFKGKNIPNVYVAKRICKYISIYEQYPVHVENVFWEDKE